MVYLQYINYLGLKVKSTQVFLAVKAKKYLGIHFRHLAATRGGAQG